MVICIFLLISVIVAAEKYHQLRLQVMEQFAKVSQLKHEQDELLDYPVDVINMVLAIEDQIFFRHYGVDLSEIFVVLQDYLWRNGKLRGASTISQQLIKNTMLTPEKTLKRKLIEVVMTIILENNFSKSFILSRYLAVVYLGQNGRGAVIGFKQGAQFYFNLPLNKLNHQEIAQLVALLKGVSYYHPIKHKKRFEKRRDLVLKMFSKYNKYYGKYSRD